MIKTNKDSLIATQVVTKISHPTLPIQGGMGGNFVTTWDGRSKLCIGLGGIKYNIQVGSPCFGWPETEYLEPGVALVDAGGKPAAPSYQTPQSVATTIQTVTCIGNEATVTTGDAKGANGVVTGKGRGNILAHFNDLDLEKLTIGDKVKIKTEGVGLKIEGFDGDVYNMAPSFLEALDPEINGDTLTLPATREVPAYAMGFGVGGSEAQRGYLCIQSCPPALVEDLGIGDLKIGDLVACRDILISYGKGYHKGGITLGVIVFGASEKAGNGPGVMAIAASKAGKIKPRIEPNANVAKYLELEA
jgi:hypothetical protein